MTRHIVCLTFDFDTESGYIARGCTTPTPRSKGEFGLVGAERTLALLKERGLPSTWFIPGFTIESHPAACEMVLAGGHEIAHHSWAQIPPNQQSRDQEAADIGRANNAIKKLTGRRARGYRSPSSGLSENTLELLIEENMEYDSSLMNTDYQPTRTRLNDEVQLGRPIRYGLETDLIEMPINWVLDDYHQFEFAQTPDITLSSLNSPRAVMETWRDEFTYMQKIVNWGVLTYTMHPHVIGRGSRMLALEKLFDEITEAGAVFLTMEEAAREARGKLGG